MSALNYKKTSADTSGSLFAIVDERISENCEYGLRSNGFSVIKLERDERLGEAVASHTDMLLFRLGSTIVGSRRYFETHASTFDKIKQALPSFEFILTDDELSSRYPLDARLNALKAGKNLFAKADTVSGEIIKLAEREKMKITEVKQGYPACTALALSDDLIITADNGMARAARSCGIKVLKIDDSEKIALPPYEYGFIGGCAGVIGNTVYFLGNLSAHPSGEKIEAELSKLGYCSLSLDSSADELFDLGGMMLINTDKNGRSINPKNPKSE